MVHTKIWQNTICGEICKNHEISSHSKWTSGWKGNKWEFGKTKATVQKHSSKFAKTTTTATNLRLLRSKRCCNKAPTCFSYAWDFPSGGDWTEGERGLQRRIRVARSRFTPRNKPKSATSSNGDSGWGRWMGGEENVIMGEFSARPVKTEVVEAVAPIWEAILGSDIVALRTTCLGVPGIKPTHCILSTSNIAPHPLSSVSTHPGRAYL